MTIRPLFPFGPLYLLEIALLRKAIFPIMTIMGLHNWTVSVTRKGHT